METPETIVKEPRYGTHISKMNRELRRKLSSKKGGVMSAKEAGLIRANYLYSRPQKVLKDIEG